MPVFTSYFKVWLQQITMKAKEFDYYSFKAPSSKRSQSEMSIQDIPPPPQKIIKPSEIKFRHVQQTPKVRLFDQDINTKINNISNDLQSNIKRRLELEKQLEIVQREEKRKEEKKVFMAYNHNFYKEPQEAAEKFRSIEERAGKIDQMVVSKPEYKSQEVRLRQIEKNKEILLEEMPELTSKKEKILMPIMQTLSVQQSKPLPVYTVPDQIKIQNFLRKVTFPETPSGNLEIVRKQLQSLFAVHQPHSDIHYLLMIIYYHEQKYMKVRKHFEQIQLFKIFNPKAYWVMAESEFGLQSYDLCLKLTEECMNRLQDRFLPRFLHLKAKCYQKTGNYINSIVCYNQLIKIKPKISDYCLERGILYHRIGYYKEAKEDFMMFGILNPNAQQIIKNKILAEHSEIRRKEYIAMLAKMY